MRLMSEDIMLDVKIVKAEEKVVDYSYPILMEKDGGVVLFVSPTTGFNFSDSKYIYRNDYKVEEYKEFKGSITISNSEDVVEEYGLSVSREDLLGGGWFAENQNNIIDELVKIVPYSSNVYLRGEFLDIGSDGKLQSGNRLVSKLNTARKLTIDKATNNLIWDKDYKESEYWNE